MFDNVLPLLPVEVRCLILSALKPGVLKQLSAVQGEVNTLSLRRARQVGVGGWWLVVSSKLVGWRVDHQA